MPTQDFEYTIVALADFEYEIEALADLEYEIVGLADFQYTVVEPPPPECWLSRTRRLLDYFAKPFNTRTLGNSLDRLMAAIARELSGCTETVTLLSSTDARGDGSFRVFTRFGPISSVGSVVRIDADGNTLETYTVESFDDTEIVVSGTKAPGHGDRLHVSYSYLFGGLEYQVRQALLELNILTATGSFLDSWGRWFGVARQAVGSYGSFLYGAGTFGEDGAESDSAYSRRIIDRVTLNRNTPRAIVDAVQSLTGGTVYLVEWTAGEPVGWIYNVTGDPTWAGGYSAADQSKHLIWGVTSRFVNGAVTGGGACVFEVWIPATSPYTAAQILEVVNQYKAAGTRAFVRVQP